MINASDFLAEVAAIQAERPTYRLGGDGSDGTCDCIGLIIGAIRRAGGSWKGTHGSNYAARNVMNFLGTDMSGMVPGWLAYKAKAPGEAGYDLPGTYDGHPDKLDYYHVGVVTGVNPLRITHCTSGGGVDGITVDTKQGKWAYFGPCDLIDYNGEATPMMTAIVTASSGKTVKMRSRPSASDSLYWEVPVGAEVLVLSKETDWTRIEWQDQEGYMMTKFLDFGDEDRSVVDGESVSVVLDMATASALMAALRKAGVE